MCKRNQVEGCINSNEFFSLWLETMTMVMIVGEFIVVLINYQSRGVGVSYVFHFFLQYIISHRNIRKI